MQVNQTTIVFANCSFTIDVRPLTTKKRLNPVEFNLHTKFRKDVNRFEQYITFQPLFAT